jgi:hypothetical protein
MTQDKIGLIELLIFLLIAFVLPAVVILRDDRNWQRKERRKAPAAEPARAPAGSGFAGEST